MSESARLKTRLQGAQPHVATVIVNWNGAHHTLDCLRSFQTQLTEACLAQNPVIVVDNGSTDDSVKRIAAAYPQVTLLCAGENKGFTGGNNIGIRHALQQGVDYIFLLNNDTILETDTLLTLIHALEREPRYGLASPVVHGYPDTSEVWFAGATLDLNTGTALHDNRRVPSRQTPSFTVPWASGCALLARASLLANLKGLDERYFLVWEDVDLCLRARAQGSEIALVPAARLYHKESRSFVNVPLTRRYYHVRNNLLLLRLHAGGHYKAATRYVTWLRLRESLRDIKDGAPDAVATLAITLRALADHRRRCYGPYRP